MSNAMVPANMGAVSSVFRPMTGQKHADDLSGGVQSGFAVVSLRGKDWRIKYRGDEQIVHNEDGEPARSIKAVIIKGSAALSKIYYEKKYAAGDDAAPDCYSISGVRPEADSPKKQSEACATCPMNRFGSRTTENGKKAKACSDNRRLSIVPLDDLDNEVYGGPMMLRVPPASLADMATFTKKMENLGFPYFSIAIRLGFADEAFPKLTFSAVRALTDDEARKVLALRDDERVDYMLHQSRASDEAPAPVSQEEKVASAFEEGAQKPPAAAVAKAIEAPKEADTALLGAMDGLDDEPALTANVKTPGQLGTARDQTRAEEPKAEAPKAAKPGPRQVAKPETPAVEVPKTEAPKAVEAGSELDDILDNILPD